MNTTPILLKSLGDLGTRLIRIEARTGDPKDECWLQDLLYRHPELLPVDEFDGMFAPAIPIGREVQSGRGPLDNLYVSPSGGITIVETKLWKNPEKHRTVVAQIIDYAKELATWNYDDLAQSVLASSRSRNETDRPSLEQKVEPYLKDYGIDLIDFQESLTANLEEGKFLLLIIGDKISPNMALLTDAIHGAPGLGFQMGLVEMRLYPVVAGQDWPLVVVPDVVGRTIEKLRGVVRVRYTQERPEVSVDIKDDPGDDPPIVPSQWDEVSFFKAVQEGFGAAQAAAAEKILDWAKRNSLRIWWGKGSKQGSFFPMLDWKGDTNWTISVWTYGRVEIVFEKLKERPPFAAEENRQELCRRLNQIPGVSIPADRIALRPRILLSTLTNGSALEQFLKVLDWVIEEIKAA